MALCLELTMLRSVRIAKTLKPGPTLLTRALDRIAVVHGTRRRRRPARAVQARRTSPDTPRRDARRALLARSAVGSPRFALASARVPPWRAIQVRSSPMTWCSRLARASNPGALSQRPGLRGPVAEFEIRCGPAFRIVERRSIDATRFGPKWVPLRVRAPEEGPARIVLARGSAGSPALDSVRLLWGDPCIEAPRSMADFGRALRGAITERGVRAFGTRPCPPTATDCIGCGRARPSRHQRRGVNSANGRRAEPLALRSSHSSPNRPHGDQRDRGKPGEAELSRLGMAGRRRREPDDPRQDLAHIGSDSRLRVLSVPSGATRAEAWNAALQEARGEFVAVLDANDRLAPTALYEMAVAFEQTPDSDLVVFGRGSSLECQPPARTSFQTGLVA